MTDYIDISFVGDKDLQRKLKRLAIKTQRGIVRPAMRKAMKPVLDSAKALAPYKTGRLKNSIKQKSKTKRGISRAMVVTGTREQLGIPNDAKGYYPAVHEYGSVPNRTPARSYLRRALSDNQSRVLKQTGDEIGKGIEKEARKR